MLSIVCYHYTQCKEAVGRECQGYELYGRRSSLRGSMGAQHC